MNNNVYGLILAAVLATSVIAIINITTPASAASFHCKNNIKVHVGLRNATGNTTYLGVVVLDGETKSKITETEENDTFAVMPFNFKKQQCVPGHSFSGYVNGTEFAGKIKNLNGPTKIFVELP